MRYRMQNTPWKTWWRHIYFVNPFSFANIIDLGSTRHLGRLDLLYNSKWRNILSNRTRSGDVEIALSNFLENILHYWFMIFIFLYIILCYIILYYIILYYIILYYIILYYIILYYIILYYIILYHIILYYIILYYIILYYIYYIILYYIISLFISYNLTSQPEWLKL